MEQHLSSHHHRIAAAITEGLSRLQKRYRSSAIAPDTFRALKGILLLGISIFIAILGFRESSESAIQAYRLQHWPPESLWRITWTSMGFHPTPLESAPPSLPRTLPNTIESEDHHLLITEDGCAIHINSSPWHPGSELWVRDHCTQNPTWKDMGSGLSAFENSINFIEKVSKMAQKKAKTSAIWIDPKELRY